MESSEAKSGLRDHRFLHLVRWEARLLGLRGRSVWWLLVAIPLLALTLAGIWRAAIEPEPLSEMAVRSHTAAVVCLMMTPLHDAEASLEQMTFGYTCLRLITYVVVFWTWLLLPGIAGGGVANDRRTGRMEELQTTPFTREGIYLAKAVAAARPFWMLGLLLFLLFACVVCAEHVSFGEVARLCWEMSAQIFLAALVTITCSALFSSAAVARGAAYLLLWLVLPCLWTVVLLYSGGETNDTLFPPWRWGGGRGSMQAPWSYAQLCWAQRALMLGIGLLFAWIGIRKMRPYVLRNGFRFRSRVHPEADTTSKAP